MLIHATRCVFVLLAQVAIVSSATYYVATNGADTNSGSESSPWKSLPKAISMVKPGDTVYVKQGTYTYDQGPTITSSQGSGTSDAWVTYKAYPGTRPTIIAGPSSYSVFNIYGAQYIELNGFEVVARPGKSTGYCINLSGKCHHIRVINNHVHDCGGGGIGSAHCDYMTIEGNRVHNTSKHAPNAESGISTWQNINYDYKEGYHNKIRNNVIYDNHNQVGQITDGNGIIIDDSKNTQAGSTYGPYKGRTLIENNIAVNNGGRAFHVYLSDNVDIFNNVAYHNLQTARLATDGGELSTISSDGIVLSNNIAVPASSAIKGNHVYNVSSVVYDTNLYYNTNKFDANDPHAIVGRDPLFVSPGMDGATANFKVKSGSPAIGSGKKTLTPDSDADGNPRPYQGRWDMGAYTFV